MSTVGSLQNKVKNSGPSATSYELNIQGDGVVAVSLQGCMDYSCAGKQFMELISRLKVLRPRTLVIDLSRVEEMQDFGLAVILELKTALRDWGGSLELRGASAKVKEALEIFSFDDYEMIRGPVRRRPSGIVTRFGEAALRHFSEMAYLVSFAGSMSIAFVRTLVRPAKFRFGDTLLAIERIGVDAIPIIALISFLLGLIIAFMSSVQLKEFGATIYVASLVALAMVRELGPIITAIIVAGRSGSSFAAEIGTMKISEEVDALFTMGLDPTEFLVIPKLTASIMALPVLTLLCDFFAIAGGLLVGLLMLDLTLTAYIDQTISTVTAFDLAWGFFKAASFGVLICWISCFRGFRAQGGADAVGAATTSAVVSSIFLIILADSIFAVLMTYWG
ncbi:MAG: hypothetical protein DRH12_08000 [Deltaproteobacteria bacterium]|nr:MAG: hypothetical protein DRH12_08000 [Deltaproteobacteria bacterium]RLB86874.1 MAG: hypothetical protein DRH15_00420 [Deltaproteobacteria bacterium]